MFLYYVNTSIREAHKVYQNMVASVETHISCVNNTLLLKYSICECNLHFNAMPYFNHVEASYQQRVGFVHWLHRHHLIN